MRCLLSTLLVVFSAIACSPSGRENVQIDFVVTAPSASEDLYLTGNFETLGPWKANALKMVRQENTFRATLAVPTDFELEYKFTLGSWEREALGPSGMVMPNNKLRASESRTVSHTITDFKKPVSEYIQDWQGAGVLGELVYWTDFESRILEPKRHISIWLPPEYKDTSQKRYRVLYMSDGQNLFDPRIANTGVDWGVDETIVKLSESRGIDPPIVVGVWSTGRRGNEYSPWHEGPEYARFLIEELMPRVNAEFRTKTGPENTFHAGSSMGGLISYYLVTRHPEIFGRCGCISTHTPLSEAIASQYFEVDSAMAEPDTTPLIIRDIESGVRAPKGTRFWFDYGSEGLDAEYGPQHDALREWLLSEGKIEGSDFVVREYPGADHNETSWRARLADVFAFILQDRKS